MSSVSTTLQTLIQCSSDTNGSHPRVKENERELNERDSSFDGATLIRTSLKGPVSFLARKSLGTLLGPTLSKSGSVRTLLRSDRFRTSVEVLSGIRFPWVDSTWVCRLSIFDSTHKRQNSVIQKVIKQYVFIFFDNITVNYKIMYWNICEFTMT